MVRIHSSQRGLQDGWTRAMFILRKHHLEKVKALIIDPVSQKQSGVLCFEGSR